MNAVNTTFMISLKRSKSLLIYCRILSVLYGIGAVLHALDILGLRLKFADMSAVWKVWVIYLFIFDLMASIGLWKYKAWGISLFLLIASSQLIAYLGFEGIFENQIPLIIFHFLTLSIFFILKIAAGRHSSIEGGQ